MFYLRDFSALGVEVLFELSSAAQAKEEASTEDPSMKCREVERSTLHDYFMERPIN